MKIRFSALFFAAIALVALVGATAAEAAGRGRGNAPVAPPTQTEE